LKIGREISNVLPIEISEEEISKRWIFKVHNLQNLETEKGSETLLNKNPKLAKGFWRFRVLEKF